MKQNEKREFLCTRPHLAARLVTIGCAPTPTVNPFDTTRRAWIFEITPDLIAEATAFYTEIGKPLPESLRG